jgi:hypothetical protein
LHDNRRDEEGGAAVLGKDYDHAYRPVGVVHRDDAFPR